MFLFLKEGLGTDLFQPIKIFNLRRFSANSSTESINFTLRESTIQAGNFDDLIPIPSEYAKKKMNNKILNPGPKTHPHPTQKKKYPHRGSARNKNILTTNTTTMGRRTHCMNILCAVENGYKLQGSKKSDQLHQHAILSCFCLRES